MATRFLVLLGALLFPAASAYADDSLRERAKALSETHKTDEAKAVKGFEALILKARQPAYLHEGADLAETFHGLAGHGQEGSPAGRLLSRVAKLQTTKSFAFASGHHLAYDALLHATRLGTYDGLEAALKLTEKRKAAKYGAYARAMATYATGLRGVLTSDNAKARAGFEQALAAACEHGWGRLAVHAAIELAALESPTTPDASAGDNRPAPDGQITEALAAVHEHERRVLVFEFIQLAKTRLAEAHPDAFARWSSALEAMKTAAAGTGLAGAPGGNAQAPRRSAVAKVLATGKKRKPLVSVVRTDGAFHITYHFGELDPVTQAPMGRVTHVTQGGLTLAIWGRGIRLESLQMSGEGIPGGNSAPARWQFFDPLAEGETWSLYPTGETRIK